MGSIFLWFADRVSFGFDWILLLFSLDWISNFYWLTLREKKMAPIGSARTSAFSFHHQQPKKKRNRLSDWSRSDRPAPMAAALDIPGTNWTSFRLLVFFLYFSVVVLLVHQTDRSTVPNVSRLDEIVTIITKKSEFFLCFFFFYSVNDPIFSIKFFEFFGTGCQSWWSILFVSLLFCFYNSMADGWLFLLFVRPAHRCGR